MPHSSAHEWLRARNAPAWVEMPIRGIGFQLSEANVLARHATNWVVDALSAAGRIFAARYPDGTPLTVGTGSVERGGLLPTVSDHQSGLQLRIDAAWNFVPAYLDALGKAGFGGFALKATAEEIQEQSICKSSYWPNLCSVLSEPELEANATAYISSALPVPSRGTLLPNLLSASLGVRVRQELKTHNAHARNSMPLCPDSHCLLLFLPHPVSLPPPSSSQCASWLRDRGACRG